MNLQTCGIPDSNFGNEDNMALTRRIKKMSNSMLSKHVGKHELVCKECGITPHIVSTEVSAFTCGRCVQKLVAPPDCYVVKEKSDKPRGWHFKLFFEHGGVVYSKGEIVTDPAEIKRLRKNAKTPSTKKSVVTTEDAPAKRPRGRPRKHPLPTT